MLKYPVCSTKLRLYLYPVGPPSHSITLGRILARWLMYLQHFVTSTVSQNVTIPWIRSYLFLGFISLLKCSLAHAINSLRDCLQSSDSGGVHHQLTPFSWKNCCASLDVCFGSCLGQTGVHLDTMLESLIGSRVCSRMLIYATASMQPSNIQTPDWPFLLMAAHTWILDGCFGLGLQQNRLWFSTCTVVSFE